MHNDQRKFLRPFRRSQSGPERNKRGLAASASQVSLLEKLVNQSSASEDILGVQAVHLMMANELETLGFKIKWLKNPNFESADLLLAEIPGKNGKFINLVMHGDTVLSTAAAGQFEMIDAQTARGSGVIDNKGGVVVALSGLKIFLNQAAELGVGLRLISSPNEEMGSIGFVDTYRHLAQDAVLALGFEPGLNCGSIVHSRRGNRWYQLKVFGREAHAGRSQGEHINAAHVLSRIIHKAQKLNRPKDKISLQIGHIEGGRSKFNVICGSAMAKIDTRFSTFADQEWLHKKLEQIIEKSICKNIDGSSEAYVCYSIADDCPPFGYSRGLQPFVKTYLQAVNEIEDRKVAAKMAGGAGDVNYMSSRQTLVLDGLGACGHGMHTTTETIQLSSLHSRSLALVELLKSAQSKLS